MFQLAHHMSGTAPDPVQAAINAQSGRFEFFKQSLTLGLAGIGGIAALFTDTTKIPAEPWARILIGAGGFLALVTVAAALFGISAYANLLAVLSKGKPVATFEAGIIRDAKLAYAGLGFAGIAFFLFGLARLLFSNAPVSADATLGLARQAIIAAAGPGADPITLDRYEAGSKEVVVNYAVGPAAQKYTVHIDRASSSVTSIVHTVVGAGGTH
jgi:hypothetical protein